MVEAGSVNVTTVKSPAAVFHGNHGINFKIYDTMTSLFISRYSHTGGKIISKRKKANIPGNSGKSIKINK